MAQQILIYIILVLFFGGTWAGCFHSREDENSVEDYMTEDSVISLNPHLSGLSLEDLFGCNEDGRPSMAEQQSKRVLEFLKSQLGSATPSKNIDKMLEIPMNQQVNGYDAKFKNKIDQLTEEKGNNQKKRKSTTLGMLLKSEQ
uniref:Uncharacterized protein n=1 Tax=Globodera rostochiensis TaxID=31243 RepID=A0A914GVU7_GLORO